MEIQPYFADAHNKRQSNEADGQFPQDGIELQQSSRIDIITFRDTTHEFTGGIREGNMQESVQREVNIFTPNKRYSGKIDLKNDDIRTIDQLNSSTIYWKNPAEKSFNDAILLSDVEVSLHGSGKLASFNKLQVRLSDIIFFSDNLKKTGDSAEKLRAKTLSTKAKDELAKAKILTEMRGDSFFFISGTFHGLFKNKTKQRYFPLTDVRIYEIVRTGDKWERTEVDIGNDFIGVSSNHIESCTLSDYE